MTDPDTPTPDKLTRDEADEVLKAIREIEREEAEQEKTAGER